MQEIEVPMDRLGLTKERNTVLVTYGVSTCIVFAVRGTYEDEDCNLVKFAGLYHWSGFPKKCHDKAENVTRRLLQVFFQTIRERLGIKKDTLIYIDELHFIGGEKAQFDENGVLLLSGTEAEIEALQKTTAHFKYHVLNIKLNGRVIHQHGLTQDDESLTIVLSLSKIEHVFENDADPSAVYLDSTFLR